MSSGGGSSSGKVDYPGYMKDFHGEILGTGVSPTQDVLTAINTAWNNSPYAGEVAFDSDADISNYQSRISILGGLADGIDPITKWQNFIAAAESGGDFHTPPAPDPNLEDIDASIDAAIEAQNAQIDASIEIEALPRFQAGMRDINAVHGSAFIIGQGVIESQGLKEKTSFAANIRLDAEKQKNTLRVEKERLRLGHSELLLRRDELKTTGVKDILQLTMAQFEFSKLAAHLALEGTRIKTVIKKEELDSQLEIDAEDAMWNLNLFKFANNALSSISGAAPTQQGSKTNKFQSALGGAASGAAMGGMMAGMSGGAVGGPVGMAAGAAIGLGASFL